MKYLTPQVKEKLHGNIGVSYVLEGDEEFETENTTKLIVATIVNQNDLITLNFSAENDKEITINSDELRGLAEELLSWADIMDETLC